jgi:DNA (cytosine-5)-methyltransferase 1
MLRIIQESKPTWVIGENVTGFLNLGLDEAVTNLEGEGYEVITLNIPACAVDAPHIRQRLWIVAYTRCEYGNQRRAKPQQDKSRQDVLPKRCNKNVPNSNPMRELQQKGIKSNEWGWISDSSWWSPEPNVGRVAHGIPSRVDRLKALGNATVPQVAYQILKGITEIES